MKKPELIIVGLFLLFIFLSAIIPLGVPDIWFHIKSGEYFLTHGLVFTDVFSYTAFGRPWIPYEWLFQIGSFVVSKFAGLDSLIYVTAAFVTVQIGLMFLLLRRELKVSWDISIVSALFFFASVFEFISARPHIVAYALLLTNLYFISNFLRKEKIRYLIYTIPITIVWANLHGSIFLDVYFFCAYALIQTVKSILSHDVKSTSSAKKLWVFSAISILCTILPPLGISQYQLLIKFFENRKVLTQFIDEWTPLSANPYGFVYTTIVFGVILSGWGYAWWKSKRTFPLFILPILPFIFMAYTASRNVYLGYVPITLLLSVTLSTLFQPGKVGAWVRYAVLGTITAACLYIVYLKHEPVPFRYPVAAAQFILREHVKGNMFNEYGYGGYLLYALYPQQKVFIDGRTEMFLCCEMPETMKLAYNKNEPNAAFKPVMDSILNNHAISFVLLDSQKHSVVRKMGTILTNDPLWRLVYWDDASVLYIKSDGKNDDIIRKFGTNSATPFTKEPYRSGQEAQALVEYRRMQALTDSARTRNAIGYILLKQGTIDAALPEFQKAIQLDPSFESPYMNIAEIAASKGALNEAIFDYRQAQKLAPDRGLIYIRLGQLLIKSGASRDEAVSIWKTGIEQTVDEDAKLTLTRLVQQPTQ